MGYFTDYPKHVFLILSNEFCERFSYYGMKAILVIYMVRALNFEDNTAVAIYHSFNVVCYFTPILGAMIADGFLGKFRTILYVSMIYVVGSVLMTVSSIPIDGNYTVWLTFVALTIIAFGTGGIKPCVSAFGGDQFAPSQQRQKDSFFSLFYMSINVGSLLSTLITPYIRSNVRCFDDDCYSLAFGIPAILMIVAIVMFLIGSRWYTKNPAGESIIQRMFGCIGTALSAKCSRKKDSEEEKKEHWLDYAEHKYDKSFIHDVKDVLRVCWLFLPLPIFWALFDQQGSRWTLQATQLNGDFGSFVMEPDMMQFLNAGLVVVFVPILESIIYPCLDKLHIPNRPLQRMGWGMVFAATAFLLAGVLQIFVDQGAAPKVGNNEVKFNFINAAPCHVEIYSDYTPLENPALDLYTSTDYYYEPFDAIKTKGFTCHLQCGDIGNFSFQRSFDFIEKKAYQIVIHENTDVLNPFNATIFEQTVVAATPKGESTIRIFNTLDHAVDVRLKTKKESSYKELYNISSMSMSEYETLILYSYAAELSLYKFNESYSNYSGYNSKITPDVYSQNGAVYTLLLRNNGTTGFYVLDQLEDIPTWTINIFIQVPQYVIMTLGECLFSVSGLGFAYSQAAPSMKSILTAVWLLTVAVGNLIVVIVAETGSGMNQMLEFFIYSGLMYVTTVVFVIMCFFYDYVEREEPEMTGVMSLTTSDGDNKNQSGVDNDGYDADVSAIKEKEALGMSEEPSKGVKSLTSEGDNKKENDVNNDNGSADAEMLEFFIYSGLMYVTTLIFVIMCFFYDYVEPREPEEAGVMSVTSEGDDEKKDGVDNDSYDADGGAKEKEAMGMSEEESKEIDGRTSRTSKSSKIFGNGRVTPLKA